MASETFAELISLDESAEEAARYWAAWVNTKTGEVVKVDRPHVYSLRDRPWAFGLVSYDPHMKDEELNAQALANGWMRFKRGLSELNFESQYTQDAQDTILEICRAFKNPDYYDHKISNPNVWRWRLNIDWAGGVPTPERTTLGEFLGESAFAKLISLNEGGYWIKPDGEYWHTKDHGAAAVEKLGLNLSADIDSEALAEFESEAVEKAFRLGWIRVDDDFPNSFTVQVYSWGEKEKNKIYDFFMNHGWPTNVVGIWVETERYSRLVWMGTVKDIRTKFFGESEEEVYIGSLTEDRISQKFWLNSKTGEAIPVNGEHINFLDSLHLRFISDETRFERMNRAFREGWMRVSDIGQSIYIQARKTMDAVDSIIEMASRENSTREFLVDWWVANWADVKGKYIKLTAGEILADSAVLESRREYLQETHGQWWLSSKGKLLDTVGAEHATYVIRNPSKFGLPDDVFIRDTRYWDYAEDEEIASVWKAAIQDKKWIRIAEYDFFWNLTVPDLSQRTQDLIWDWAKDPTRLDHDPQDVWIDVFTGRFLFGRSGNRTTLERIVKNFDFGDGVHEEIASIIESALFEGRGYWLTPDGRDLEVGDVEIDDDAEVGDESEDSNLDNSNTHTAYLRRNKLFSGDRYRVATRKGWIAARNIYGNEWTLIVDKLDSRARDRIWDWAKDQKDQSSVVRIYPIDDHWITAPKTTFKRITKDFDFGEGRVHESAKWSNGQRVEDFWINSSTGAIVDAGAGHGHVIKDNPDAFGISVEAEAFEYEDEYLQHLIVLAIKKGWVRVTDDYGATAVGFECIKDRYTKSTIVELCAKLPTTTIVRIHWSDIWHGERQVESTAGKIVQDSSILESISFSDLLEDFEFIQEGAHDQVYRQEALKAWSYVEKAIRTGSREIMGEGVSIPGYPDLRVYAIPRDALPPDMRTQAGGGFVSSDPSHGGRPTIMLVIDSLWGPPLSGSDLFRLKEVFVHEFIHYLDNFRNPQMILPPTYYRGGELDKEKYLSSPLEFNAMYQSAVASIESTIETAADLYRNKRVPEDKVVENMYYLRSPKLFSVFVFQLTGEGSGLPEVADKELRQRIMKRAALDYPRVLAYAKEQGLPFG